MSMIVSSLLSVTSIALTINIINYARQILIASTFGATHLTDAYFTSYIVVTISLQLFSNAFSTVIVPVFSELRESKGIQSSWKFISTLLNLTVICSVFLAILVFLFSNMIISLIAPGFVDSQRHLSINLLRLMSALIILNSVNGVFFGILSSLKKFVLKESSILLSAILNLSFFVIFCRFSGIYTLAYALIFSTLIQLILLIYLTKGIGFKYEFKINFKDIGLIKFLRSSSFVIIGTIIGIIAPVVDRIIASKLSAGSLSSLDYGEKIVNIYTVAIIVPLNTILLTSFSELINTNKRIELIRLFEKCINMISFVIFPMAAALFVLAAPIVNILFQHGAFGQDALQKTVLSVRCYSFWLLFTGIGGIASRIFYARQKVLTPIVIGIVGVGLSVLMKILLVNYVSHGGLALANSISTAVKSLLLVWFVKKMYDELSISSLINNHIRILIISIVAAIGTGWFFNFFFSNNYFETKFFLKILYLSFSLGFGLIFYFALSAIFQARLNNDLLRVVFSIIKLPPKIQQRFDKVLTRTFIFSSKNDT